MHQLLLDSFWPLHKNIMYKKCYLEVQDRISSGNGAQNDFISTGKPRQTFCTVHFLVLTGICWFLLFSKQQTTAFDSHIVIMSFCWPSWMLVPLRVHMVFDKWRNTLCNSWRYGDCNMRTFCWARECSKLIWPQMMYTCSLDHDLVFSKLPILSLLPVRYAHPHHQGSHSQFSQFCVCFLLRGYHRMTCVKERYKPKLWKLINVVMSCFCSLN